MPNVENQEWLNWLLLKIQSLPYPADSRWAFYRVVQEKGFSKQAYKNKFLKITSRARKEYWNGWKPGTLTDESRSMLHSYGIWNASVEEWIDSQRDKQPFLQCEQYQENIVFVAYEAQAMTAQFEHYLGRHRVCLVPFRGDASVGYKYRVAKAMEDAHARFGKHIVLLYFGDYDQKGMEIPENAVRDLRKWCSYDFEYHRLGINEEHIADGTVEVDPSGRKYQWEALDDNLAHHLLDQVFQWWDKDVVEETKEKERQAGLLWSSVVDDAIRKAKEGL